MGSFFIVVLWCMSTSERPAAVVVAAILFRFVSFRCCRFRFFLFFRLFLHDVIVQLYRRMARISQFCWNSFFCSSKMRARNIVQSKSKIELECVPRNSVKSWKDGWYRCVWANNTKWCSLAVVIFQCESAQWPAAPDNARQQKQIWNKRLKSISMNINAKNAMWISKHSCVGTENWRSNNLSTLHLFN